MTFTPAQQTHLAMMQAILNAVQETPLVLKGGTALLLCYGLDRFSWFSWFSWFSSFPSCTWECKWEGNCIAHGGGVRGSVRRTLCPRHALHTKCNFARNPIPRCNLGTRKRGNEHS